MAEIYIVTRRLQGAGTKVYEPGEEVDVSDWKHRDLLVSQRRIRPKTSDEKPAAPKREYQPYRKGDKGASHANH